MFFFKSVTGLLAMATIAVAVPTPAEPATVAAGEPAVELPKEATPKAEVNFFPEALEKRECPYDSYDDCYQHYYTLCPLKCATPMLGPNCHHDCIASVHPTCYNLCPY